MVGQRRDSDHRSVIALYGAWLPTNLRLIPTRSTGLVRRVKENYQEPPPTPPKRAKRHNFSSLTILLLDAVTVMRGAFSINELRKLLGKDERLRQAMGGTHPVRASIGRRLSGLVPESEEQVVLLGRQVVEEIEMGRSSWPVSDSNRFAPLRIIAKASRWLV